MNPAKQTILCVEEDKDTCELITFLFQAQGFDIKTCNSSEEVLSEFRQDNFQAIILNNRVGNSDTTEACKEIRNLNSAIPIVFLSGEARAAEIDKAFTAGANSYLVKPADFDKLVPTVIHLINESISL